MRLEDTERLEQWKKDTLSKITEELAARSETLRIQSIEVFNVVVGLYARKASAGFMQTFGFTAKAEIDAMDKELKDAYASFIVSALNDALPLDHPFLVALIFSEKDPQLRMCAVCRKGIPGIHELVRRNLVPFLRIINVISEGKSEIRFWPVEAEYLTSGDKLEDLYKL